jgi:hypothetical protein
MTDASADFSPQRYARVGGLLYLIIIVAGINGELFVRGSTIVSGDAAATARNLMTAQLLWRTGIAGDLVMHICDVGLMLVFFVLLRPVSRNLAMLAVLFNLIQTSVLVANKLTLLQPLFLLGNAEYLKAFTPQQLEALSYVSLRTHDSGFGFGLIFFGMECLVVGYLIFTSGYFPKTLGVLMQAAGVCYLTNSFALILAPALASRLFPFILLPPFIGELSMALWLLVKGVDLSRWPGRHESVGSLQAFQAR